MSDEEREAVLTEVHAGHFAVKRMLGKINQRFYWLGIVKDVEDWVGKKPISITNCSNIVVDALLRNIHYLNLLLIICFKVCTCVPCQKFEKVKTEAPELKSIKPVSPWYMIGEFYSFHI